MQQRRLRIPPDGPMIIDGVSGAGPLDVGDGTPGLVFRAQGIRQDAPQAFTGAELLLQWQDLALPPGIGPAVTVLPWSAPGGFTYDHEICLHCRVPIGSAAVGQTITYTARARNLSTLVVQDLFTGSFIATDNALTNANVIREFDTLVDDYDQFQLAVQNSGAAVGNFDVITDLLSWRMTQYATGSA